MNLVLLEKEDFEKGRVVITGERALHIFSVLKSRPGDTLKAGIRGGCTGVAHVAESTREQTVLEFSTGDFSALPPEKLPLTLAVALPRPQSFKKTLHFAVSAGVRKIVFFQSARVEKSFWNSSVLKEASLAELVREGLEQGVDTVEPEICFFRCFRDFAEDSGKFLTEGKAVGVVAHPSMQKQHFERSGKEILLALGPEGGFVPSEVRALEEKNFLPMTFGRHILRVEFAAATIVGALLGAELS